MSFTEEQKADLVERFVKNIDMLQYLAGSLKESQRLLKKHKGSYVDLAQHTYKQLKEPGISNTYDDFVKNVCGIDTSKPQGSQLWTMVYQDRLGFAKAYDSVYAKNTSKKKRNGEA